MATKATVFLNLHFILVSAWRRRYVILVPMLVMPVLALVLGVTTQKQYISHTTVLIQETTKLNPFLSDFSVSTQLKERMAGLEALLHSRHMLLAVAEELNWISDANDPRSAIVIGRLSSALSVRLIGSDMVKLTYKSDKPQDMENVLTVVSKHFLNTLLAPERSSLTASETFLESQLTLQQTTLVEAEKKLAQFKAENSARLPNQYSFDIQQLRSAEEKLREKETELVGAQAKVKSLRTQLMKTNPMLSSIEESLVRKTSELAMLKTRYTDRHSAVVSAQREIERLNAEREILVDTTQAISEDDIQQLWHLATSMSTSTDDNGVRPLLVSQMEAVELAKSTEQQLLEETAQLRSFIETSSEKLELFAGIEQQLNELERDIQTKQTLYNDFLKRYELAKVTGALGRYEEGDRVKVIDQPYNPQAPINPSTAIYIIAGVVGGLLMGIGLALLFEISDTTVIRRDVLEKLIGAPVITRVPKINANQADVPTLRSAY